VRDDDDVPLKEFFERVVKERDERYTQRFEAQETAITTAMNAAEKAVNAAMAAAEKAVAKAEAATDKRLEGMNEFRATLSDQQSTFVRQDVADTRFKGIEAQIAILNSQASKSEGRGTGLNQAWGYIIAIAALGFAAAEFFTRR
jgi:hypothetical protein